MDRNAEIVIAVDIGTTGTKALAVERNGTVRHGHSAGYPLDTPLPGRAEQNPEAIFEAVLTCIERTVKDGGFAPGDILAVSFSSANHSLILLDGEDRPLTPSVTWADLRAAAQAERLRGDGSGLAVYKRTGTPVHPMSPLVKLIWFREEKPDLWRKARRFVGIKEYVLLRLFGEAVTEYSMATATGLFNLETLDYDDGALALAGVERERLPRIAPTTGLLSGLSRDMAARLGLSPETPFILGGQDGVLANLGIGAMDEGVYAVTIGTSSAVRTAVRKPLLDPEGRLFCYALTPDDWIVGGPSNNGAVAVKWMAERLFPGRALEDVLPMAEQVPPGANGLLFAPFLSGERAPYWDPRARGVLLGLTLAHREEDMIRAAMEGVVFQVAAIAEQIRQAGRPIREVRASGGFARSRLWCQMLADVLDTPVCVPPSVESSALGAAKLAFFALDGVKMPPWREPGANAVPEGAGIYRPDAGNAAVYRHLMPVYLGMYDVMKHAVQAIDGLPRPVPRPNARDADSPG
jgi:gluconokinase